MDLAQSFEKIGLALGLGMLVGLQRERVQSQLAGIRTFTLITVLGTVCALVALDFGGWLVGVGAVAVAAMLGAGNLTQVRAKTADPGLTTEFAALLMYGIGAYLVVGHTAVALALGGATALLLHWKAPLHAFVAKIGEGELAAIMQLVLIALVILPILPDESYGPYDVLNPRQIWLMVVLIVGISLGGFLVYKWLGPQIGSLAGGVLGGLISSTATTVSYARRTRQSPESAPLAAVVLILATTVASLRVLVEIAVVAPDQFFYLGLPLIILTVWLALLSLGTYMIARGEQAEIPPQANPADLTAAIIFGCLFAGVLLATAAAQDWLGDTGLYGVAVLSGVHDLDAITLSTAQLVQQGQVETNAGWRVVLLATMSNLVAKGCIVAVLGDRRLLRWMAILFGAALCGGIAILLFFPDIRGS